MEKGITTGRPCLRALTLTVNLLQRSKLTCQWLQKGQLQKAHMPLNVEVLLSPCANPLFAITPHRATSSGMNNLRLEASVPNFCGRRQGPCNFVQVRSWSRRGHPTQRPKSRCDQPEAMQTAERRLAAASAWVGPSSEAHWAHLTVSERTMTDDNKCQSRRTGPEKPGKKNI